VANKNSEAIALVYAESLFELALEKDQADEIEVQFQNVADVIRSDSEISLFLETPAISNDQKKACLTKAFEGRISDTLLDFLKVVADKNRLDCFLEMQTSFSRLADQRAGRIQGVLTTAVELSRKEQARLGEKIGRALKKTIELETIVDPAILGGMVLRIDDTLIDGSVKRSLGRLKKQLRVNGTSQLDATQAIVN
jgi:F-type H+-transporting ATPase subunit delta